MSLATNPSRQNRSLCEHKKTTVVNGIFKVRQGVHSIVSMRGNSMWKMGEGRNSGNPLNGGPKLGCLFGSPLCGGPKLLQTHGCPGGSRVSKVRVGIRVSVRIRVSLVFVIGGDRTFRHGVMIYPIGNHGD